MCGTCYAMPLRACLDMALRYVLRAAGTEGLYGARVGHSLMPSRTTASYWQCNVCRYKPLTPVLIVPLVLRTSGTDKVDAAMVGCYQCSVLSRAVVGGVRDVSVVGSSMVLRDF